MRFSRILLALFLVSPGSLKAQGRFEPHRADAERLIALALRDSMAYDRLAELTDLFGARPSGSQSLERAIDWIVAQMKKDGFDRVYTEPVMVTHWVRGAESAVMEKPIPRQKHEN